MDFGVLTGDNIDPQTTRILALAALFKGEFSIDWLLELARAKASDTLEALELGLGQGWLRRPRAGTFEFVKESHRREFLGALAPGESEAVYREAAAILGRERPESPEKSGALAELLLHLANDLEGCSQLIEAGEMLRKSFKPAAALECYAKAVADLGRQAGGGEVEELFIKATLQYSKLSSATSDSQTVIEALEKAVSMASLDQRPAELALLRMHLAKHEWLRSNHRTALRHFNDGWSLSRGIDDENHQRSARIFSMYFHYWQGRFKDAVENYERYVPEIENLPTAHFPLQARLTIGSCYAHCGQIPQGLGMLEAIREHGLKSGNTSIASHALVAMAVIFLETGRVEEAAEKFEQALAQSTEIHNIFVRIGSLLGAAHANFRLGRLERASAGLREFKELSRDAQMDLRNYSQVLELCWAMETGRLPAVEGFSFADELGRAVKSQNVYMKGMGHRFLAFDQRRRGRSSGRVIQSLEQSAQYLEESGHQLQLSLTRLELARELINAGREDQARTLAGPSLKFLMSVNEALVPDDLHHLARDLRNEKKMLGEILALGQDLATLRPNRDLLGRVISTANRLTGAERGAIFIMEKSLGRLVLKAAKNLTLEDVEAGDFSRSLKLIEETFGTAQGRVVDTAPEPNTGYSSHTIRSCICVPMSLRREAIGVLYLDNRLFSSAFTATDLAILDYFAAQASIAMENARAYSVLQERYLRQMEEKQYHEQQYLERFNFEDLIGRSRAMQNVFKQIDAVTETEATALILGETGVGKELVARAIHRNSRRREGPFIRVNCSAFSEHLISSELFGHEKGAFTGAAGRRLGRFELADGGTLFLDEIGDIPLAVQVRLLRVLQSKEFERVGGQVTLKSEFRLMAATNRDLLEEVRAGRFRQDLYYRLNVFPIQVPPLRERPEDIPLLAHHFISRCARRQNKVLDEIPAEEMARLTAYHWPGNVRELENLIERGVILCSGSRFRLPEFGVGPGPGPGEPAGLTHAENERAHLVRVLKRVRGKVSGPGGAAEVLDLHPNTLRYRMRKLGVNSRDWQG
jgi:transcriptional regulator with GAF, ATPase, and Fis domain